MKIFVTGSTGMVGSFLVEELLKRGHKIRVLVRPSSDISLLRNQHIDIVEGDISVPGPWMNSLKDQEILFHIAALMKDWGPKKEFIRHNITGTINVLKAAADAKIRRLIYTSTRSVMGMGECRDADETSPYRFSNYYGYSKMIAEKKVVDFQKETGIDTVIIRPTWIIGPRDRYSITNMIALVKKGDPILINNGNIYQSFIHPKDVVHALILGMEYQKPGVHIFLIDNGEKRTIRELFELFAKKLSIELHSRNLPYWKAYIIGHIMSMRAVLKKAVNSPPMTPIRAKMLGLNHTYSIQKAKQELGFNPHYTLENIVHDALEWWKSKGIIK